MHLERMERVRAAMAAHGVDVLLLSVGPDLPWLTGYEAMPLERLTMLVVPRSGDATLVVPRLEAPRVVERPDVFGLRPWGELEDPVALVAGLVGPAGTVAIGDRTWARFVLDLQGTMGDATRWQRAAPLVGPLRARKDPDEVAALRDAAEAADRVAAQLQGGEIRLIGRTEAEVSAEIGRRLVDEGHHRVNFAIVGTGPNAASPHHEAGPAVIAPGQVLLCDFGGTWPTDSGAGYCSDITRCVAVGPPAPEVAEAYAVLQAAQAASVASARVGVTCEAVDAAARQPITEAGYGDRFIHRTGHGIGVEEHEDPYIVEGNRTPLEPGHAFSVEPGIYTPGAWGLRLEDIVVATEAGPLALNRADHDLVVVEV
ncbi:MAG TPA: Xaa-Pro peptidase family protein [Iamia sp.]